MFRVGRRYRFNKVPSWQVSLDPWGAFAVLTLEVCESSLPQQHSRAWVLFKTRRYLRPLHC